MTVYIAQGQPKSGSTFVFMAALAMAEQINQCEYYTFKSRIFGDRVDEFPDFYDTIFEEQLDAAMELVPEDKVFLMKTHMGYDEATPRMLDLIRSGKVKFFTTFRDPRDAAVAILDVAAKEREAGEDRWFWKYHEVAQLKNPIHYQSEMAYLWSQLEGGLSIPYYMIACAQDTCVQRLAEYMGVGWAGSLFAAQMEARKRSLPEFNKGRVDRFIDDLSPSEIRVGNEIWAQRLRFYDSEVRRVMAENGLRMLAETLLSRRDRLVAERLASEPAAQ